MKTTIKHVKKAKKWCKTTIEEGVRVQGNKPRSGLIVIKKQKMRITKDNKLKLLKYWVRFTATVLVIGFVELTYILKVYYPYILPAIDRLFGN